MNARSAIVQVCVVLSLAVVTGAVRADTPADYPTALRVEFVLECMRERDNPQYELVHKCSCVIDRFAAEMSHDAFMEAWTTAKGVFIAGERGAVLRNNEEAQKLARYFQSRLVAAEVACFLRSPGTDGGPR
ncbi:MAG: hypothetical protein WDZ63_08090 [Burkholderiales bacterium]